MENWRNYNEGETKISKGNPVPVPLCPPQIPHGPVGSHLSPRGMMPATKVLSHGIVLLQVESGYCE
jgi:hypothetical protein